MAGTRVRLAQAQPRLGQDKRRTGGFGKFNRSLAMANGGIELSGKDIGFGLGVMGVDFVFGRLGLLNQGQTLASEFQGHRYIALAGGHRGHQG